MSARDVLQAVRLPMEIVDGDDGRKVILYGEIGPKGIDAILSALRSAGFTPPVPTGAIHKALQDAFQMGGIEAVQTLDRPDKFIQRKHRYSDAALDELLKAAQEDSRG